MTRLTPQLVGTIQPLVDGGPHPEPDRAWWWALAQQLQEEGLLIVRASPRGATLAWTQRGSKAIEAGTIG